MNETHNGYGFLNVWFVCIKLRQNAGELLNDGEMLLHVLEKMCPMKLIFY
jgi:hypothetical protein